MIDQDADPGFVFLPYHETASRELPGYTPGNVRLGGPLIVRDFFGRSGERLPGPQGYFYEVFREHSYVGAHFHSTDQFQLFFPSPGTWYLRHAVESPMVLYSDAYTTYGPFGTGEHSMSYFTLRPSASAVTGYMPGARDKMRKDPGRRYDLELGPYLARPVGRGDLVAEAVLGPEDDGLAVHLCTAGAGASMTTPPSPERCGGQYVCVLRGSVLHEGNTFGPRSLGWSPPGSQGASLSAAPDDGVQVLVCQFPVPTTSGLGAPDRDEAAAAADAADGGRTAT